MNQHVCIPLNGKVPARLLAPAHRVRYFGGLRFEYWCKAALFCNWVEDELDLETVALDQLPGGLAGLELTFVSGTREYRLRVAQMYETLTLLSADGKTLAVSTGLADSEQWRGLFRFLAQLEGQPKRF